MNSHQQYLPARIVYVSPNQSRAGSGGRRLPPGNGRPVPHRTPAPAFRAARLILAFGGRLALTGLALGMMSLMLIIVAGLLAVGANAAARSEPVEAARPRIKRLAPLPALTPTPLPPRPLAPLPALTPTPLPPRPLASAGGVQYTLENGAEVTEYEFLASLPTPAPAPEVDPETGGQQPAAAPLPASPLVGWPAGGQASQGFGCSPFFTGLAGPECPATAPWFHDGLDIANIEGSPARAALAGTVIFAGPDDDGPACGDFQGYGLSVVIDNGQGWQTMYGHLARIDVVAGQAVTPDTLIGAIGQTGCASGPHLHFGLKYQGQLLDPALFTPE